MKTNLLLQCAAVLSLAATACADVVIYQGTARTTKDAALQLPFPNLITEYFVVDYQTGDYGMVGFFGTGTGRKYIAGAPGEAQVNSALLTQGKTATVISSAFDSVGGSGFTQRLLIYRGVNSSVTLTTTPLPVVKNLPRVLLGSFTEAGKNNGTGYFLIQNYSFVLNPAKTIAANNAKRTLQQAMDALGAELKAKGYQAL